MAGKIETWHIKFEYADFYSGWQWRPQECYLTALNATDAVRKCVELYGLGTDCEYRIKDVKKGE